MPSPASVTSKTPWIKSIHVRASFIFRSSLVVCKPEAHKNCRLSKKVMPTPRVLPSTHNCFVWIYEFWYHPGCRSRSCSSGQRCSEHAVYYRFVPTCLLVSRATFLKIQMLMGSWIAGNMDQECLRPDSATPHEVLYVLLGTRFAPTIT